MYNCICKQNNIYGSLLFCGGSENEREITEVHKYRENRNGEEEEEEEMDRK